MAAGRGGRGGPGAPPGTPPGGVEPPYETLGAMAQTILVWRTSRASPGSSATTSSAPASGSSSRRPPRTRSRARGPRGRRSSSSTSACPTADGLDVTRELRRGSDVPIVVLTARGDESDRIVGLELGADDYVVKPFSPKELVARVRAVLRRTELRAQGPDETLRRSTSRSTCGGGA